MLSHITTPIENNTSLMNKDNYLSSLQNNLHELLTIQFNLFHEYDKLLKLYSSRKNFFR